MSESTKSVTIHAKQSEDSGNSTSVESFTLSWAGDNGWTIPQWLTFLLEYDWSEAEWTMDWEHD